MSATKGVDCTSLLISPLAPFEVLRSSPSFLPVTKLSGIRSDLLQVHCLACGCYSRIQSTAKKRESDARPLVRVNMVSVRMNSTGKVRGGGQKCINPQIFNECPAKRQADLS